jgi:hypothetical protein
VPVRTRVWASPGVARSTITTRVAPYRPELFRVTVADQARGFTVYAFSPLFHDELSCLRPCFMMSYRARSRRLFRCPRARCRGRLRRNPPDAALRHLRLCRHPCRGNSGLPQYPNLVAGHGSDHSSPFPTVDLPAPTVGMDLPRSLPHPARISGIQAAIPSTASPTILAMSSVSPARPKPSRILASQLPNVFPRTLPFGLRIAKERAGGNEDGVASVKNGGERSTHFRPK